MAFVLKSSTAASLPLDELQTMSRGDLMQASNILHAGWTQARHAAQTAAQREHLAQSEIVASRQELAAVQEQFDVQLSATQRKLSAVDNRYQALVREHQRLVSLLATVDEASAVRTLDSYILSREEAKEMPPDAVVRVAFDDLEELLSTVKSRKFRIADMEDQLAAARADTIALERTLRLAKPIDVVTLEKTQRHLEEHLHKRGQEVLALTEKLSQCESQLRATEAELNELKAVRAREAEEDDLGGYGYAHQASMLSSVSWSTASPAASRRKQRAVHNGSLGNARSVFPGQSEDIDDGFGPAFNTTTASQTENIVLQNVELLYRLQRDLADLKVQRVQYEEEAARHKEEKEHFLSRITSLEEELEKQQGLVETLAGHTSSLRRSPNKGLSNNSFGSTSLSDKGDGEQETVTLPSNARHAVQVLTKKCEELDLANALLKRTSEEQRRQVADLIGKAALSEAEQRRLQEALKAQTDTCTHLNEELARVIGAMHAIASENAELEALVGMDRATALSMLELQEKIRASEARVKELESAQENRDSIAHRAKALEKEIAHVQAELERHQHLVLETTTERDAALRECSELLQLLDAHAAQSQNHSHMAKVSALVVQSFRDASDVHDTWWRLKVDGFLASFSEALGKATAALLKQHRQSILSDHVEAKLHRLQSAPQRDNKSNLAVSSPQVRSSSADTTDTAHSLVMSRQVSLLDLAAFRDPTEQTAASRNETAAREGATLRELLLDEDRETFAETGNAKPVSKPQIIGLVVSDEYGAVLIDRVVANSAAYNAGLKASDCILSVDSTIVNSVDEFVAAASGKQSFVVSVVPGGGRQFPLTGALPGDAAGRIEQVRVDLLL